MLNTAAGSVAVVALFAAGGPEMLLVGSKDDVEALAGWLDVRVVDHGGAPVVRDSHPAMQGRAALRVWGAQMASTVADMLGGIRRASDLAGVDVLIPADLVVAEREAA